MKYLKNGISKNQAVEDILTKKGFWGEEIPKSSPYDLLVNDCVKVNIRTGYSILDKTGEYYKFVLKNSVVTCDIYILLELDSDNNIEQVLVIPSKFLKGKHRFLIRKGESKYNRFIDRFDYISSLAKYLENVT